MAAVVQAPMSGVALQLLTAAVSATSPAIAPPPSFRDHTFVITGAGTVTTGAVVIESGTDPFGDVGTWAAIVSVGGVANPATVVSGTDILINYHGLLPFVRARTSTALTGGGTVTVTYTGAKSY